MGVVYVFLCIAPYLCLSEIIHNQSNRNRKWQRAKKDFTLLLIAFFCSSLAHAQKQVPAERKDSIDNGSNIIKIVGNHSNKGAANNALDVLSGQAAGVNVTSNGLDRMAMLNSVRVHGTTSIIGGNDPLVLIDGVASDVLTLSTIYVLLIDQ